MTGPEVQKSIEAFLERLKRGDLPKVQPQLYFLGTMEEAEALQERINAAAKKKPTEQGGLNEQVN